MLRTIPGTRGLALLLLLGTSGCGGSQNASENTVREAPQAEARDTALLIVAMGGVVMIIVLAILLPIFEINNLIR